MLAPGAREEAQDGLHRQSWRDKDKTSTLKGSREEQSRADKTECIQGPTSAGTHRSCSLEFNLGICVCFFDLYCDMILFGGKSLLFRVRAGISTAAGASAALGLH